MSVGKLVRRILGKRVFAIVGEYYRKIFVDLEKVAMIFDEIIPNGALILDIGGGDGELLNHLLHLRKDLRVTMIDISTSVGNSIKPIYKDRVNILPGTSILEYNKNNGGSFNTIIVSDVIHHIPSKERNNFFLDIKNLCNREVNPVMIIIKDFEDHGLISFLGYVSDRYISNDKNVNFISQKDLQIELASVFDQSVFHITNLSKINFPNYAFFFTV